MNMNDNLKLAMSLFYETIAFKCVKACHVLGFRASLRLLEERF